jgi:ElaB/YqjD/DUF883 family membrane-anchored ribosome-binding protein
MDSETEVIKRQMEGTRTALSEKLEQLEAKVSESVTGTVQAVASTVEGVTDTVDKVTHSVDQTVDAVKQTFDLDRHARERPWMLFGGAVFLGFVGGSLLKRSSSRRYDRRYDRGDRWGQGFYPPSPRQEKPKEESSPGILGQIGEEVSHLKQLGIGMAMGLIRDVAVNALPAAVAPLLSEAVNNITEKVGGKTMDSSQLKQHTTPAPSEHQQSESCDSACL